MRQAGLNFKKWTLIALATSLAAFTGPQRDDLVELKGFLYGRNSAQFRNIDHNQIYILKPGTRALVKETKYFTGTKNYGMCLDIKNATDLASNDKCIWVYYDVDQPNMTLYSLAQNKEKRDQTLETWAKEAKDPSKTVQSKTASLKKETHPAKAEAVQTTRPVTSIREKETAPVAKNTPAVTPKSAPTTGTDSASSPANSATNSTSAAKLALNNMDQFNKKATAVMAKQEVASTPSCPDGKCNTRIESFENCSGSNKYLESPLASILEGQSSLSNFYKSPQKEIIRTECVQRNMVVNGSGTYNTCSPTGAPRVVRAKACVSENYVNMTSKAFNLAADCFGSFNGYSETSKKQMALAVFSLMAQESGMHMNVTSNTGAGGAGQLTKDAIVDVNKELGSIRSQLSKFNDPSSKNYNPNCSQVLSKVFEKPMDPVRTCDRLGVSKENPLKNIAYSFAYQNIVSRSLNAAYFQSKTYDSLISQLPEDQSARLKFSLAGWGHNTGPGGLQSALRGLLRDYVRKHKVLKSKRDVDQLLSDLSRYMRTRENKFYQANINTKVSLITAEPTSCLAN